MAISTAITTLNYKVLVGDTFAKLCDIINYPDLGATPSKLDTTDLSQTKYKTNILGLQEIPDLTFEANYDEAKYNTISGLTGTYYFQLLFGSTDGKFEWNGQISIFVSGAGVDEVRKMTITVSASTPIVFTTT